jgi:hypothetical protein
MNPKNRSRLIILNSCLLICGLILAGFLALKHLPAGNEAKEKQFRERINQTQDMDLLRKKLVEADDYILISEQLIRELRYTLIGVASAAAFFGAFNLAIIRRKE